MEGGISVMSGLAALIIPGQIQWPENVNCLHRVKPDFEINGKSYTWQRRR